MSVANYVILNIASMLTKAGGVQGPKYVLLLNMVITILGILLALLVNKKFAEHEKQAAA